MEILINDLIEQSQKRLKRVENGYMDGNLYGNETGWLLEKEFIKGRIEGYCRVLQLFKEEKLYN